MSAYVVNRNHIRYLVEAARRPMDGEDDRVFRYTYGDPGNYKRGEMRDSTDDLTAAGQMLWDELLKSETMPGSQTAAVRHYHHQAVAPIFDAQFHPGHIFSACDCYESQCEHPGWRTSQAQGFIASLRKKAARAVAEEVGAKWNAPELD